MRTYTSDEASVLTSAKPAQIEHLVRTGAVRPAQEARRRGMSRGYSLNNLAEITIAAQLVEMGMPVRAAGLVIERVRGAWHVLAHAQQRARASVLLLTRGTGSAEFGGWHSSDFATPEAVAEWLRAGNSGACLNVLAILNRLEQATSDTFEDPTAAFRARLKDAERTVRLRRAKGSEQ